MVQDYGNLKSVLDQDDQAQSRLNTTPNISPNKLGLLILSTTKVSTIGTNELEVNKPSL
jgi:hypothetical protein